MMHKNRREGQRQRFFCTGWNEWFHFCIVGLQTITECDLWPVNALSFDRPVRIGTFLNMSCGRS